MASFIGSLVGGPVADRFDRRQVMLVVSALQALAAVGFVVAVATPAWWIGYVAQAAISFLGAFFGPAANAAVPNLVAADDLRPAASMLGATWGAMLAVGAAFGAGFTALFGRTASFVADALSFVPVLWMLVAMRFPQGFIVVTLDDDLLKRLSRDASHCTDVFVSSVSRGGQNTDASS